MGIAGSKDETGKVILGNLPPGFLDAKGRELRDKLDVCLEKNMWFFSVGGLLLTVPVCIKYKTERPFFVAAILCPVADMYYGTLRCARENDAFREHYKYLQEAFNRPVGQQADDQHLRRWLPPEEQQQYNYHHHHHQLQQQQHSQRQLMPSEGSWQSQPLTEGQQQVHGEQQGSIGSQRLLQQQQQQHFEQQQPQSWWKGWK